MEMATIFGMGFGFLCIVISILLGGSIWDFYDLPSVFIVFGGVFAATVASYPIPQLKIMVKVMKNAFVAKKVDLSESVEMIITIANVARREGILALEETVQDTDDHFLKKGIMLIVDGSDPELVRSIMETELDFIRERHAHGRAVIDSMAAYSPAFGMIGTLIGLINMLTKLDDPGALGPGMATALITTFYGVLLANMLFNPISKKLKIIGDYEYLSKELILEGLLSIQDGENPRIIREKLNSFLSASQISVDVKTKATAGAAAEGEV